MPVTAARGVRALTMFGQELNDESYAHARPGLAALLLCGHGGYRWNRPFARNAAT